MPIPKTTEMTSALNLNAEELPALPEEVRIRFPSMEDWWLKVRTILQRQNESIEQSVNAVYDTYKK